MKQKGKPFSGEVKQLWPMYLDPSIAHPTVRQLLEEQAARYGEKPFLIFPEKGQTFSYRHYNVMTARTANLLRALGVGKGDKVALAAAESPGVSVFLLGMYENRGGGGPGEHVAKGAGNSIYYPALGVESAGDDARIPGGSVPDYGRAAAGSALCGGQRYAGVHRGIGRGFRVAV